MVVLRSFRSAVVAANKEIPEDGPPALPEAIRLNDLRHTVASVLLAGGHSDKAVSRRLGHVSAAMTLQVYGHVMPDDDDRLAAGLGNLFSPAVA
jgi:integrase